MSLIIKSLVRVILFFVFQLPVHILALPICIWSLSVEIAEDYKEFLEVAMAWSEEKTDER